MDRFAANQNLTISTLRIGQSAEPVLVIDDFLADPKALIESACNARDWHELAPGGYPGKRASLPGDYARSVLRRLDAPIRRMILQQPAQLERFECAFSMVTRPPAALTAAQRVPHIDVARDNRVAVLHYLCDARLGGTAFFRQDATNLEQITPENRDRYLEACKQDLRNLKQRTYPDAQTPGYTRTGFTEARFNRLVAYRSFTLHSGMIENVDLLTDDPATGRLTANFFVDYTPAQT